MESNLREAFDASASALGLASGLYYVVYGPLQIAIGPIYDHFGYRRPFYVASMLVFLGCFLAAAPIVGIGSFAAGRVLMGTGSAFAFIGTMYVASVWFPRRRWAFISGLTTALGMGGAILGQGPVAKLVQVVGWRKCWVVAGAIGIAVTLLLRFALPPEPEDLVEKMNGENFTKGAGRFLSYLIAVAKNPQTWLAGMIGCALFMPLTVFADFWGVHYIELLTGATAAKAAAVNGMLYVGWLLGSPIAGHLSDRIGRRKPFLIGSCTCGLILLVTILTANRMQLHLFGLLLLLLGIACSPQVICFTVSGEHNSKKVQGTAIAAVNTIVMLFGGAMQPVVGFILDRCAGRANGAATAYSLGHFRTAFAVLPAAMAIGLVMALAIRESGEKHC